MGTAGDKHSQRLIYKVDGDPTLDIVRKLTFT